MSKSLREITKRIESQSWNRSGSDGTRVLNVIHPEAGELDLLISASGLGYAEHSGGAGGEVSVIRDGECGFEFDATP